jgi:hypothetical protein
MQSGSGCFPDATGTEPKGVIESFDLRNLDNPHYIASNAENPAWQPVSLGG